MKIRVKGKNQNINLSLPTTLIFSPGMAWIGSRFGLKYVGDSVKDIPPEAVSVLFAEFRRIKKRYGSWELVSVESADGSMVTIIL